MKNIFIFGGVFICLALCSWSFWNTSKPEMIAKESQPNFIIILTDDQGNADVGFNGCKDIPTPNLDQIAYGGVIFTQGYVSYCVCAPSRAGLLTGRYQDRFGYTRNPKYLPNDSTSGLPLSEQMMPEIFGKSGYKSMAIGKWHLGAHPVFHPLKRGFTSFFGFLGGGHQYFPENLTLPEGNLPKNEAESYRSKLIRDRTVVDETEYITDAFSREAVRFVKENQKNPFFLYLAYNAPHAPLQATPKYLERFSHIQDQKRRTYAAMVSAVDDGVGNLLQTLKELHLEENTIVIYLSDNGGPLKANSSDNGNLRGAKGSLFEGGIRVPFAMQWKGHIPEGIRYDKPVISLDIFSTFLAQIKGGAAPANPLDGINLLPFLTGERKDVPHKDLFWKQYDKGTFAVISAEGDKLLNEKNQELAYYDLLSDIEEKNNIIQKNQKRVELLKRKQKEWDGQTKPPFYPGLQSGVVNSNNNGD